MLSFCVVLLNAPGPLICAATSDDQYPEPSDSELQSAVLLAQGPV